MNTKIFSLFIALSSLIGISSVALATEGLEYRNTSAFVVPEDKPFTIQVASYLSKEEADDKISDLKKQNVDAYELTAEIRGLVRYRVCVGHFESAAEARKALHTISHATKIGGAIVQKLKPTITAEPEQKPGQNDKAKLSVNTPKRETSSLQKEERERN